MSIQKNISKNFIIFLKKVLTREAECSIMTKLSRKEGGSRSLKIEQQERSVKPYTAKSREGKEHGNSYNSFEHRIDGEAKLRKKDSEIEARQA